ncbi:MAG: response regulator [bacterium]
MDKKKILIVDDDFSVRETLGDILRSCSYEVFEAATGAEAAKQVELEEFDCVIVDLRLPDATGHEVIEKISGRVEKNKIIIITGYASSEVLSKALLDAEYFLLLKPVTPEQLLAVVRKIATGGKK